MRWANDKYKGILAFRANLRNRPAHEERHEFISITRCRSAEFPSAIFCHSADLETLSAIKLHDSNSWQATSHVAREENRDRLAWRNENNCLHHACCNCNAAVRRKCARCFIRNQRPQKKVWRMHFQRVNFVLVCPPVKKFLLHNAVFNTSASPLQK